MKKIITLSLITIALIYALYAAMHFFIGKWFLTPTVFVISFIAVVHAVFLLSEIVTKVKSNEK